MKTALSISVLMILWASVICAQHPGSQKKTRYGIEVNQFLTGSGFSSGTEAYFSIVPDQMKQISIGIFYCPEVKKISGLIVHHERSLIRINRGHVPAIVPYAFYNLIYRKTSMRELLMNKEIKGDMVTYTSMEHHLGIGLRFKVSPSVYFKSEAGYGVYLGSIKKPSAPDPLTGEISGTNGFGAIARIGLSYTF